MKATEGRSRPRAPLADKALVVLVAAVLISAIVVVSWAAMRAKFFAFDAAAATAILGISVSYDVLVRRMERVRRLKTAGPYITINSVWTFGGALILPLEWSTLLTIAIFAQDELQGRRGGGGRPFHRFAYNAAAATLACAAASVVSTSAGLHNGISGALTLSPTRLLAVFAALISYALVSAMLIALAIALSLKTTETPQVFGTRSENVLEFATLGMGALVGIAGRFDVWMCVLVTPAMLLLQRSALIDQLESAASEDSKTGLLNSAAWEHLAERDLAGSMARKQPVSLLAIDLDNFKRVNDQFGHLSGDEVLKAVAICMKTMLRDRDLISRFGGEEFMALLPGADSKEAMIVAERLRTRIENLRVARVGSAHQPAREGKESVGSQQSIRSPEMRITVSVGVASYPSHGHALGELMEKADAALYQAKGDGRNRVRLSPKLVEAEAEESRMIANETDP